MMLQEKQRLTTRVIQLADHNEELEEQAKRLKASEKSKAEDHTPKKGQGTKQKSGNTQMSTPKGSPTSSAQRVVKGSGDAAIDAQLLDNNPPKKFQFTKQESANGKGGDKSQGKNRKSKASASRASMGPDDNMSDAGSEASGGTIRRGIKIIRDHAPQNVYQPSAGRNSRERGNQKGYGKPPIPTMLAFNQSSQAEEDVPLPSDESDFDDDQVGEEGSASNGSRGTNNRLPRNARNSGRGNDANGYQGNHGQRDALRGRGRRDREPSPSPNRGNYDDEDDEPPYRRGRRDNFGRYPPRRDHGRDPHRPNGSFKDPKLSKYDGKIAWRSYEVKLMHMARKYDWDDDTKLAKLVEALDDKALTFFSNLPPEAQGNFQVVRKKMNNRFIPLEPATTVRKQLQTIQQNAEEALEEWAERCQQCAFGAWGEMSEEVAELAAVEAFLGGVLETEAAFFVMEKDPHTLDEALELLKKAIHGRKSLNCRFRNAQRTARTVSFASEPIVAEVRTTGVVNNPTPPESKTTDPKLEADIRDLQSSMTETKGQIAKILELLNAQNVERGRARFRSPSPSPDGPCYRCQERGHIARNCPNRSRSPSPMPRRESSTNPENK